MASKPKIYWDSCIWIALINQEPGRYAAIRNQLTKATNGEVQIVTSSIALAETVKAKCGDEIVMMNDDQDDYFAEVLLSDYVTIVDVDWHIAQRARQLFKKHQGDGLKKPQDAIHLATAVVENVDALHTFDGEDLLGKLTGKVLREDGVTLQICKPPQPDVLLDGKTGELFAGGGTT